MLNSDHLREGGWVLGHKLVEFLLVFIGLKLFTNLMSAATFGEFNLALTAVGLMTDMAVMPIAHAYYRVLPQAREMGNERAVGVSMLRWYVAATFGVAGMVAVLTIPLSDWLGIGKWTALATSILFLANRWRALGVEISDMRRDRRRAAVQNLGFIALQSVLVAGAAYWVSSQAAVPLLGYAVAAAVFFGTGTLPVIRAILQLPSGRGGSLSPMIRSFGVSYGALLVCQWVQNFAERYILRIQLDFASAGTYVAAYQVCGVPYMLLSTVLNGFCVPIAYQHAGAANNPAQLVRADRVLLSGLGIYVVGGLLFLPLYAFWGTQAVRLLTHADFVLPAPVLVCIAGARFMQCLGLMLQPFFAVHQRMTQSILFRLIGGLLVVPVCWWTVGEWGIAGAAGGVVASGTVYTLLVILGPNGCLSLIRGARRDMDGRGATVGAEASD